MRPVLRLPPFTAAGKTAFVQWDDFRSFDSEIISPDLLSLLLFLVALLLRPLYILLGRRFLRQTADVRMFKRAAHRSWLANLKPACKDSRLLGKKCLVYLLIIMKRSYI